jgi:hypothetical protein
MLVAAASNLGGLFGEIYMFLQLGCVVLFGGNRPYLHLETPKLQKYSFQDTLNSHRVTMC